MTCDDSNLGCRISSCLTSTCCLSACQWLFLLTPDTIGSSLTWTNWGRLSSHNQYAGCCCCLPDTVAIDAVRKNVNTGIWRTMSLYSCMRVGYTTKKLTTGLYCALSYIYRNSCWYRYCCHPLLSYCTYFDLEVQYWCRRVNISSVSHLYRW